MSFVFDAEQGCTPPAPNTPDAGMMREAEIVVDQGALMRELIAHEKAKRTRNATKRMNPIVEVEGVNKR